MLHEHSEDYVRGRLFGYEVIMALHMADSHRKYTPQKSHIRFHVLWPKLMLNDSIPQLPTIRSSLQRWPLIPF
jgi:hypothetical protein